MTSSPQNYVAANNAMSSERLPWKD